MFSYERTWFESFLHCMNRGDNSHEIRHKSLSVNAHDWHLGLSNSPHPIPRSPRGSLEYGAVETCLLLNATATVGTAQLNSAESIVP